MLFWICLSACISQKSSVRTSQSFLYMLLVPVAGCSSDDNAIRYVLPVLWTASRLHILGQVPIQNWNLWRRALFTVTRQVAPLNCAPGGRSLLSRIALFSLAVSYLVWLWEWTSDVSSETVVAFRVDVRRLLGRGVARLNATSFVSRVIVRQGSTTRLDCQYQNVARTEWYMAHSLITASTYAHK